MAIRKFRKNLIPFIWVITIAFVISLGATFYGEIKTLVSGPKNHAFKLNGTSVDKMELERTRSAISDGYTNALGVAVDNNVVGIVAFDETINKELTLQLAKKLNVKVASKDVDGQLKEIEASVGDKDQFQRMLEAQGFTRATLKKEIENSLLVKATVDKITEGVQYTDEDLLGYFSDFKEAKYRKESFENVKAKVIEDYKADKGRDLYVEELFKGKASMKLEGVAEEYKDLVPKIEYSEEGFNITNAEFSKKVLTALFSSEGNLEEAQKIAKEEISELIKISKIAMEKGAKVREDLPTDLRFNEYQRELFRIIKSEVVVTDEALKTLFEKTKTEYDIPASIDARVAILPLDPNDKDKENSKIEATNILKSATKENFAELAKKHSVDYGSAIEGGSLGWFGKGDMVPEFDEAVFKGEVGKIYPEVVTTQFGNHIIYVEEAKEENGVKNVKASHILIPNKVSTETKEAMLAEVNKITEDLKAGTITFDKLSDTYKNIKIAKEYKKILTNGNIEGNTQIVEKLFAAPLNKLEVIESEDAILMGEKIAEQKAIEATFEDEQIKEQLKIEYVNNEAIRKISELMKK